MLSGNLLSIVGGTLTAGVFPQTNVFIKLQQRSIQMLNRNWRTMTFSFNAQQSTSIDGVLRFSLATCVFSVLSLPAVLASEHIELIGVGEFSGTESDLSGQVDQLENGEPHNRLGGFSALEYSGKGKRYVALPDRGPDDGATGYLCRYQLLDIDIQPGDENPVRLKLIDSVFLKDKDNRPFTGASSIFTPNQTVAGRLDPEGFRFGHKANFYVSDEYGPQLIEFNEQGREVQRFSLPEHLSVKQPAESKRLENQLNRTGRSSNKGMEGLAISEDQTQLYGIMQHVLLQDGERDEKGVPRGLNCRIVVVDVSSGAVKEFVYQLEDKSNGLNEIVAVGKNQFLVIERDGQIGVEAKFKKIMKIDLSGATEIQDMVSLPAYHLPTNIHPVNKEVFIDFLSPEYKLSADQIPEKLEGLTFGEPLKDGRSTLIVASDNDFNAESPSLFYVFAVSPHKP